MAQQNYATLGPLGWNVFKQYMAAVERNLKQNTAYTEKQCGACPYDHLCCSLPVWISPFEAFGITWFLNVTTKFRTGNWKRRILARAREYLATAKGTTGVDADRRWAEKSKLCVFYDTDRKQCGIYEARPVACRTLYSMDNCNASRWIAPQADEEMLRRLVGFAVVRKGSTWLENLTEMNNMLSNLILRPDEMVLSAGTPGDLYDLIIRSKTETISDEELLYGEGNQFEIDSRGEQRLTTPPK